MPAAKSPAAHVKGARRPARKRSVADARRNGIDTSTNAGAALVSEDKPLTDKQRLFVKFWAAGETLPNAYAKAGFSPDGVSYAYRMVHMPNILALYNEEKRAYEAAADMTRKRVIDGLLDGIEMAKMVEEPSSVIQGWKTIGQLCGYFEPVKVRHEISIEGKIVIDRLNRMSDEDLFRIVEERARQIQQEGALDAHPALPDEAGA